MMMLLPLFVAALQVQLELDAAGVDYAPGSDSWDVNTPGPFDKVVSKMLRGSSVKSIACVAAYAALLPAALVQSTGLLSVQLCCCLSGCMY
jgi:hypothetical protein